MEILHQIQRAVIRILAGLLIERPARRRGIDGLLTSLENTGRALEKRASAATGRPRNMQALTHIIGIERWGQRRLRVALGEPTVADLYDSYRPDCKHWDELLDAFRKSRQETISLGKLLRMVGVDPTATVEHNQFGPLTLLGWLYYLDLHAKIESLRIY